ncbi:hypothetical protein [Pseudomonas orientalis]|uniref:Uncharacterized protein n=1 Tax=Pseudomonas orientalis TaxID=76758 RepID=A0A1H2EVA6_9PSED|nr:hypothetical protein [Pseudomonas orientalis]KRP67593.1 hypothetical protein TU82_02205 [Pseudomonas orientalis]UOB22426.1 hypothetical protein MRY17_17045 [Pseudomonas orientalis]SDT99072.1 hypothetical protein SAMN04490197_1765 [Pseudomonas orientalis]
MTNINSQIEALAFFTSINTRLGGIALSYLATLEKISEVSSTNWSNNELDRYELKQRMKEVGSATYQFYESLHENSIMALSKAIEDITIELKRYVKFKFDPIKNNHDVIYLKDLQIIRALANIIKHNISQLERNTSESAKFLVDECAMENDRELRTFIHKRHESFNIPEHIPKVYLAMLDLVKKALRVNHPLLDLEYNEAFNLIYIQLLPEVLNITRPYK